MNTMPTALQLAALTAYQLATGNRPDARARTGYRAALKAVRSTQGVTEAARLDAAAYALEIMTDGNVSVNDLKWEAFDDRVTL